MPFRDFPQPSQPRDASVEGPPKQYALLEFGADGAELPDADATEPPDGTVRPRADGGRTGGAAQPLSTRLVRELRDARRAGRPYTDVFVFCHGWLADLQGAEKTYREWLAACEEVRPEGTLALVAGYRPLVIALHWPSRPNTVWKRGADARVPFETTPAPHPDEPPRGRRRRVTVLDAVSAIIPTASFYTMKRRSGRIGRHAVAPLLADLQRAATGARFHLMGHSFGAKLVAEALADKDHDGVQPVESVFLIEGALSAWAFCHAKRNPYGDPSGTAVRVFSKHMVQGAIVCSTSRFDYALGKMFPAAQAVEVAFRRIRSFRLPFARLRLEGEPPRLGAIGVWSFADRDRQRGILLRADTTTDYGFERGAVHHLISDAVVNLDGIPDAPLVGAHSNIAHPEVAAAYWQVVLAGRVAPATAAVAAPMPAEDVDATEPRDPVGDPRDPVRRKAVLPRGTR